MLFDFKRITNNAHFSIASRLRPTASRAAAASHQRSLLASSGAQGPSSQKSSPSSKHKYSRQGRSSRFTRKRQSPPPPPVASTETSTATNTDTEPDPGDNLDPVPGPSSQIRSTYQLRSRPSTEGKSSLKSSSFREKGTTSGLDHASGTSLRSAHILSEKERNLRRRSHKDSTPSTTSNSNQDHTSQVVDPPTPFTTGSCASSR